PGQVGLDQQRILIAIDADFAHFQAVAGGLAFGPEFLAAAAVKRGEAGAQRLLVGGVVHVSEHQHLAALAVLHDGREQSILILECHVLPPPGTKRKSPLHLAVMGPSLLCSWIAAYSGAR